MNTIRYIPRVCLAALLFSAPAIAAERNIATESFQVASSTFQFATEQSSGENMASRILGTTVVNDEGETVGEVNDLLFSTAGQIDLVVIGVGGFLEIGEKDVALPFVTVRMQSDSNGRRTAHITLTKEQLEAAPEFKTLSGYRTGMTGKIQKRTDELTTRASEVLSDAKDSTGEALASAGKTISSTYRKAKNALETRMQADETAVE